MQTLSPSCARRDFYRIVEDAARNNHATCIASKSGDVVIMNREDVESLEETAFILSMPGALEQIVRGARTSLSKCTIWKPRRR